MTKTTINILVVLWQNNTTNSLHEIINSHRNWWLRNYKSDPTSTSKGTRQSTPLLVGTHSYILTLYLNLCPHTFLSKVTSSVNCNCAMSCKITSILYFFGLPLPLLNPSITNLSHLHTGASVSLLITCQKSSQPRFVHLVLHWSHPTSSRISSFLNSISPGISKNPSQQPHLRHFSSSECESSWPDNTPHHTT